MNKTSSHSRADLPNLLRHDDLGFTALMVRSPVVRDELIVSVNAKNETMK